MEFKKYRSIENTYREKYIEMVRQHGYDHPDILWYATEKIHGANFSFHISREGIKLGRKEDFLEKDEKFFNAVKVFEKYKDSIVSVFDWYWDNMNAEKIIIYGELFGGSYPHPDVPRDPHGKKLQKGVFYCPHNDFYVIDINIEGGNPLLEGRYNKYDRFSNVLKVLEQHSDLRTPKVLATGTFDELLNYKNDGLSQVYLDFGLPPIEDNIMEGYVMMPDEDLYFRDGSRVAFKNKNEKFAEKAHAPKRDKIHKDLDPKLQAVLDAVDPYITENRLRNILSHIGPVTNKEFGKLAGAFIKDIYEDFIKDNTSAIFNELEQNEVKLIQKTINKMASKLISKNFLNIIDNNF